MANQKTPGLDGFPAEIYKRYEEMLLPELLKTFNSASEEGGLPLSMRDSTIIVLPKEGKDLLDPSFYRPIVLLGTDVKILAKILAEKLKKIIQNLVHMDQTGFIPNRSTSMNIRRVWLNLQAPTINVGSSAILSLDAAKAFDSLEWHYLWQTSAAFQFGPNYVGWVRLLYEKPRLKVKINNKCSESFFLTRGTRLGCPLSPLLLALAMEPLAITIRALARIQGFQRASGVEKIALYADVVLFLGDTQESLVAAMDIITDFGRISGVNINWDKSMLLPVDLQICHQSFHRWK